MSMRGIDFGAVAEFGVGFSTSSVRKGVIFATGVRRESRTCHPTERGVSPTALCGRGAEACGDDLPVVAVDARGRQVQHDAPRRGLHPGAELPEMFVEPAPLR